MLLNEGFDSAILLLPSSLKLPDAFYPSNGCIDASIALVDYKDERPWRGNLALGTREEVGVKS